MSAPLTAVRLRHSPEQADAWLRFGRPAATRMRGGHGFAWFAADSLFGYVDWRAGDYGTVRWTLSILRASSPGVRLTRIPGIAPGAELVLGASGKAAVHRVFGLIDAMDAAGIDPADVDPDHWRSAANDLATRGDLRPFDLGAHHAARARRAMLT